MADVPDQDAPSLKDGEPANPHRWLHRAITGQEYDGAASSAQKSDPPLPLWIRATVAKVVRDVIEDSRYERECYRPRISAESMMTSSVARGVLHWILGTETFELSAGPASLRRLSDGKSKTLICRNGQLYCWLETRQQKAPSAQRPSSRTRILARAAEKERSMRAECIDLSTDALGASLVTQSWDKDRFPPAKVQWGGRERLRPALMRDEVLTQAALRMESEQPWKEQAAALAEVAIRRLKSSGVVPELLQSNDVAITPPSSVSVGTVYAACMEYPELWPGTAESGTEGPDVVPDVRQLGDRASLLADLARRL